NFVDVEDPVCELTPIFGNRYVPAKKNEYGWNLGFIHPTSTLLDGYLESGWRQFGKGTDWNGTPIEVWLCGGIPRETYEVMILVGDVEYKHFVKDIGLRDADVAE